MGAGICAGVPYKEILNQYGSQLGKLVMAQRAKELVSDKFGQFGLETNNLFSNFTVQTNSVVDQNTSKIKQSFEGAKRKLDEALPGGISTLERMKGQSINELLGYNTVLQNVDSIKNQVLLQATSKKDEVMAEINTKKSAMIQKIDKEKPPIPIYDQLPEPLQKQVIKRGSETFADQIQQNQDVILQQVAQQFSLQGFSQYLGVLNPAGSLQQIVDQATGGFLSKITSLLGLGGAGGQLGGLGQLVNGGQNGLLGGLGNIAGMLR